ncbi:potassium transporter Kup [Advenella mimigardefordensis]|uniref:Probable potassium transport system protein Kup n=1 Tax=Advenella mimigardefordensis (strain DSM 17166 / LMG 22922 / DPN7) TaxID=1247726 RepID=W0PDW3_ADVMD|nr:potassium transporter Kup [Advenella mimigardefordensis]AHG63657.1 putative potassium transport system protein [Advenella mimigardefordensis DPN7]
MQQDSKKSPGAGMLLGALGVVYGDIGTSPLYTIQASLNGAGVGAGQDAVLGILSILFWLVMIVVSVKYVILVLRADNKGEGGVLALMELAIRNIKPRYRPILLVLGIFGACLFYGDSVITPAISVLSALEGISVISDRFDQWILPLSVVIMIGLFLIQSHGTGLVGRLFGPIMFIWFLSLGLLGIWNIIDNPVVLLALEPIYALRFIMHDPIHSFLLLGYVVLALTGAEALYADMGHFGRPAISRAWFWFVLPALLLCYFGQGAMVIQNPAAAKNPFFMSVPVWGQIPMVILATMATVIASQAVISGAFSVTRQAVQIGLWPRMDIRHTSSEEEGQIYMPRVNGLLFVAVIVLVLVFQSSEKLAHAYGFAVTGTMLTTSILAFSVMPGMYKGFRRVLIYALLCLFLIIDVLLFSANAIKIEEGGWLPLIIALGLFTLMMTWRKGRERLERIDIDEAQQLKPFLNMLLHDTVPRVPGTAVFMHSNPQRVPSALLHNLKHNKVLHQQLVFLSVKSTDVPFVSQEDRFVISEVNTNAWQVTATYGFKQEPNVPELLEQVHAAHPQIDLSPMVVSYFMSRQTIMVSNRAPLIKRYRRRLFAFMSRNAARSTRFYKIPPNRVIEMGIQVEL